MGKDGKEKETMRKTEQPKPSEKEREAGNESTGQNKVFRRLKQRDYRNNERETHRLEREQDWPTHELTETDRQTRSRADRETDR